MRSIDEIVEDIITLRLRYLKTYTGKVVELDDATDSNKEDKIGRVKCIVYELGWTDNDVAPWCYPNDKNSLISPKVDDYVRINFMDDNIDRPYYSGIIGELEDMIPDNYEDHNDQVLFESTDKKLYIKYNEEDKEYIFEHENGNKITINEDGYVIEDTNGNSETWDDSGIVKEDLNGNKNTWDSSGRVEEDANSNKREMTSTGIKDTDTNGNTIEMTGSTVDINGNSKKFVTYTELNIALQAMVTAANSLFLTSADNGVAGGGLTLNISAAESQKARTG